VTRLACLALAATCASAQVDLNATLKRVEARYNRSKTLKVTFQESYTQAGRVRKPESGELYLRKPGKMRWDYADPAGKLFISDGKYLYLYTPSQHRAEKMKMKETDDLRAPLAFLLGKLDFSRDFSNFQVKPAGADLQVTAQPKSEKLPYQQVDFVVGPESQIKRLNVVGHDNSILAFNFENEVVNPALDEKMFRFVLPEGTAFVDTAEPKDSAK
jgi:outer membrane lipoprotein carrier protein